MCLDEAALGDVTERGREGGREGRREREREREAMLLAWRCSMWRIPLSHVTRIEEMCVSHPCRFLGALMAGPSCLG